MAKITYIPGEIANAAIDEHGNRKPVTRTHHIFDDTKGKSQAEVNADIDDSLADRYTKAETYSKSQLDNMITTPEIAYKDYDTYADMVAETNHPAGAIYRVANYDGTQTVTNKYAEYSWDGTQYILMAVRDHGIDDAPAAGSENLVKSNGVVDFYDIKSQQLIGFDNLTIRNYSIDTNLRWYNGKHVLLAVNQGDKLEITANSTHSAIMAFLTSSEQGDLYTDIPVVSGTSRMVVTAGDTANYTVPSSAKYLLFAVYTDDSSLNYLPSKVVFNDIDITKSVLNKIVNADKDAVAGGNGIVTSSAVVAESNKPNQYLFGYNNISVYDFSINTDLKWYNGKHILINCKEGDRIYLKANSSYSTIGAFLTSSYVSKLFSNIPIVSGQNRIVITADNDDNITVPANAKYLLLVIYTDDSTKNYLPSVIKINDFAISESVLDRFIVLQSKYYNNINTIDDENGWIDTYHEGWNFNSGKHKTLNIKGCKHIFIQANENKLCYYLIVKNETFPSRYDTLIPATGQTVQKVDKLACSYIEVPSDATYLIITSIFDGNSFLPLKLYIDNYDLSPRTSNINPSEVTNITRREAYRLIWEDDFDILNADVWKDVNYVHPTYYSDFYNDNENRYVADSKLILKCMPAPSSITEKNYKAAYVSTAQSFAIKEGKIEAKMRFTGGSDVGFTPAFWGVGQTKPWPKAWELDIMEADLSANAVGTIWFHSLESEREDGLRGFVSSRKDIDLSEWHIYSIEWNENTIVHRIDGEITGYAPAGMLGSDEPLSYPVDIRFNIKRRRSSSLQEAALEIDYVKVYSMFGNFDVKDIYHKDVMMNVGEEMFIDAKFKPLVPSNCAFSITSDDDSIVEVAEWENNIENSTKENRIKAMAAGETYINMTTPNGVSSRFKVTVTA